MGSFKGGIEALEKMYDGEGWYETSMKEEYLLDYEEAVEESMWSLQPLTSQLYQ